jgi:hypothetical protein
MHAETEFSSGLAACVSIEWVIKTGATGREPSVRSDMKKCWLVYKREWPERRVGSEHERDGRCSVFAETRALAGFGAPFDDEVLGSRTSNGSSRPARPGGNRASGVT